MATRVIDIDNLLELLGKYKVTDVSNEGGQRTVDVLCPTHDDTNPSFKLNIHTLRGGCVSCGAKHSLETLISAYEGITRSEALKIISPYFRVLTKNPDAKKIKTLDVSQAQLDEWCKGIETHVELQKLMRRWGWTQDVIIDYGLGVSDDRLVIPMYERDNLIGLKFYSPNSKSIKYQNFPGTAITCWPIQNLEKERVFLVEGEKDCLTMISAGFNAVTFTGGAGSVAKDYIKYFAGKDVYIIYDIDEAGRKGAVTVANMLCCATKKVHIVDLPLDGVPKGDLTDAYMKDPVNFSDFIDMLVDNTDEYIAPAATVRVVVPPEVHKTYLEDIVKSKLFYKRVNIKIRIVNNAQNNNYIVPKDVEITCNRDNKDSICCSCPAFFKHEGINLHIKPEYPELLSMIGNNTAIQRRAIQSMSGVAEGCPKFHYEQKSHQSMYPIVAIPAIEADKKAHNYSMHTAWALNVASEENEDYDVEGVVLANPETQHMDLVMYRMTKDAASIDSFELTDEMIKQLEIFACQGQPLITLNQN